VGFTAPPPSRAGGHPGVAAGEAARTDVARRGENRPSEHRSFSHAEVETDLPHDPMIGKHRTGGRAENTGELVHRADDEADRPRAAALEHAGLDARLRAGRSGKSRERQRREHTLAPRTDHDIPPVTEFPCRPVSGYRSRAGKATASRPSFRPRALARGPESTTTALRPDPSA